MSSRCAWRIPPPLLCLILCLLSPQIVACEELRLDRRGQIGVSMNPVLDESKLYNTSYMVSLDQLFRTATATFAAGLAEGLEKSAFRGQLQLLPGYLLAEQSAFRDRGEPDSFLITIDLRSSYGLSEGSSLAACLVPASCFLLSSLDMLTFRSRTEATVNAFYFPPDGPRLHLLESRYESIGSVSGDFFDAMDMSKEFEWVTLLTGQALEDLKAKVLSGLPSRLLESAVANAPEATAPREQMPAGGGGLKLEELVRRSDSSVFKISTSESTGSGFVISRRGFGMTTLHVVEDAKEIRVRFHDGTELPARVVASEPDLDLAVLVFENKGVVPLPLGDSGRIAPGDRIAAIGYPEEAGLSGIQGKISSLEPFGGTPLLHVSASLPHGNSGAPLLNETGEAVGIAFRRTIGAPEEIAFGIPINAARQAFESCLDPP